MNALCPCGYDMPSPIAADMCARECDDADRETRQAARAASPPHPPRVGAR